MATPRKFSANNPDKHTRDFSTTDGAGNKLATPAQVLKSVDSNLEELREHGFALCGIYTTERPFEQIGGITKRAASTMNELSRERLVEVEPLPVESHPICVEIGNASVAFTTRDGLEWAQLSLGGTVFQREVLPLGDIEEKRLVLGYMRCGLEQFAKDWLLESGHPQGMAELRRLAAIEKAKRLDFERKVALLPAKLSPQSELAAGIAAGVAQALAALNLKPATTP